MMKVYLMTTLMILFSREWSDISNIPKKIKVIGTAIMRKNDVAVITDDGVRYYLDEVEEWGEKYLGKKVKVTGELVIVKYDAEKVTDSIITAIPQQRLGTWRIIKKPKWKLVE